MTRRFLLDNDGSNIFFRLTDDIAGDIAEAVGECPANVTTYLLCAGAGTFYYPTRVGEVMPSVPRLIEAHRRGLDPFGMLLGALRQAGKESFITYRMNDVHNPEDGWNTARFKAEHPDCVVDPAAVQAKTGDWMSYCLDYSRPEVQAYILETIREMIELYGGVTDGLQLDWMRFPRHLSGGPEEVWAKREAITSFTADVRAVLERSGRKVLLAARVATSLAGCRFLGMDVAEWARQGLVDFLVASPFLTTDFAAPLSEFRAALGDHPAPLYAAFDFGHGPQSHCPESLRAAATGLYASGADGIYVFNFPCWEEYLAARPYHWLAGLHDRASAAAKPLLFSAPHSLHRIANVDLPAQLPLSLPAGASAEVTLQLPSAALPCWRALFLVQSGGDIALALNGIELGELPAKRRAELFVEYIDHAWLADQRPRKEDCRVFRADPPLLRAGQNRLALTNTTGADLEIGRVNLGLW